MKSVNLSANQERGQRRGLRSCVIAAFEVLRLFFILLEQLALTLAPRAIKIDCLRSRDCGTHKINEGSLAIATWQFAQQPGAIKLALNRCMPLMQHAASPHIRTQANGQVSCESVFYVVACATNLKVFQQSQRVASHSRFSINNERNAQRKSLTFAPVSVLHILDALQKRLLAETLLH